MEYQDLTTLEEKIEYLESLEENEEHLGKTQNIDFKKLSTDVGIYKVWRESQLMYIGRAIELSNRGLRKRINDYIRKSPSGRKNSSAKNISEDRDHIEFSVITTGSDEKAVKIAKDLEKLLIIKYSPALNIN